MANLPTVRHDGGKSDRGEVVAEAFAVMMRNRAFLPLLLATPTLVAATVFGLLIAITTAAICITAVAVTLLQIASSTIRTRNAESEKQRITAMRETRVATVDFFDLMVDENDPAWMPCFAGIQEIMRDADTHQLGDDLAIRMDTLHREMRQALVRIGRADSSSIRRDARDAAVALAEGAMGAYAKIVADLKRGDEERADTVTRRFAETARAVAGISTQPTALPPPSASAALQRITALAEDALAVDPDLVDDTGARLDSLVRVHLPRLLARHAEAARAARTDTLVDVDAELAQGVERIRASVDEAFARDARRRFDALREEVAFLSARRGETQ